MAKQITRCLGCHTVTREFGGNSYKVELEEHVKNTLTGEIKTTNVVGRICKSCAIDAGYKVVRSKNGK